MYDKDNDVYVISDDDDWEEFLKKVREIADKDREENDKN